MSLGLSHIVLHACTPEDYERTLAFYTGFGFNIVLDNDDKEDADERKVWLKLSAAVDSQTTDVTIKLAMSTSSMRRPQPPSDIDWSLEETAMVLAAGDLKASCARGVRQEQEREREREVESGKCQISIGGVAAQLIHILFGGICSKSRPSWRQWEQSIKKSARCQEAMTYIPRPQKFTL